MRERTLLQRLALCTAFGATAASCDSLITKPTLYGTVTARVQRREGSAIAGAGLVLYTGQRVMGYSTTDASGSFTFVDVPEGVYGVRASPPAGYVGQEAVFGGAESGVADQIQLSGGRHVDVRFNFLKLGNGTITARVRGPDGQPVAGIAVSLYSSSGTLQRGVTNASGAFAFDAVPLGNYGVFAARPIVFLDSAENPLPGRDGLLIEEGTSEIADFLFATCTGSITANVRDEAGAPVPGTLLTFYGVNRQEDTTLGPEATRVFADLPCGQYGLRVRPPVGWTAAEGPGTTFRDQLGIHRGTTINTTLTVMRIGRATVRIRVVDDGGTPIENIRAVLYTGAGLLADAMTNAEGFFVVPDLLVNAEYGVRVQPPAGYTAPEASGSTYLDGIRLVNGETRDIVFRFKRN